MRKQLHAPLSSDSWHNGNHCPWTRPYARCGQRLEQFWLSGFSRDWQWEGWGLNEGGMECVCMHVWMCEHARKLWRDSNRRIGSMALTEKIFLGWLVNVKIGLELWARKLPPVVWANWACCLLSEPTVQRNRTLCPFFVNNKGCVMQILDTVLLSAYKYRPGLNLSQGSSY